MFYEIKKHNGTGFKPVPTRSLSSASWSRPTKICRSFL